jgi:hypothetical protein
MVDILPTARVSRAFGSEIAYSDALSNVHKFNSRLLRERRIRLRLPFVDSQNHLWKQPTQRLMPFRHDQVSSYARKQWHKKRPYSSSTAQPQPTVSTTNSYGINEQLSDPSLIKTTSADGSTQLPMEDDPRVLVRAGDLGMKVTNNFFFLKIMSSLV